mgnify:FL=1
MAAVYDYGGFGVMGYHALQILQYEIIYLKTIIYK